VIGTGPRDMFPRPFCSLLMGCILGFRVPFLFLLYSSLVPACGHTIQDFEGRMGITTAIQMV
jgi:hypothetical protein